MFEPIKRIATADHPTVPRLPNVQLQLTTLEELKRISPYEFPPEGFHCTVTISRIIPGQSCWYPACNRVKNSCLPDGIAYKCS